MSPILSLISISEKSLSAETIPETNNDVRQEGLGIVLQDEQGDIAFSTGGEFAKLYRGASPVADFLNQRLAHILDRLSSVEGGRLLDAGCGPGVLLTHLNSGPFELFGVDASLEMIRETEAATRGQAAHHAVARLERLPYPSNFFDVILVLGVLEYTKVEAALAEIARVAKPGAVVLVSMLNRESLYWCWELHIRRAWLRFKSVPFEPLMLHNEEALKAALIQFRLEPLSVKYYNVNICVEPLSRRYPNLACRINRVVKNHVGTSFRRLLHTGFILEALKQLTL